MLLTAIFYRAESLSLKPNLILESFKKVGLWPWNKEKIFQACKEHSPTEPKTVKDPAIERLVEAIQIRREERITKACQLLSGLKTVVVPSPKISEKTKKLTPPNKNTPASPKKQKQKRSVIRPRKDEDRLLQPPIKRVRKVQLASKKRGSKRAKKRRVLKKNEVLAPTIKRTSSTLI